MDIYLKQPWATIFGKLFDLLQSLANFGRGFFETPISAYIGFFPDSGTSLPILNYTAFEITLSVGLSLWFGITLWKWIKSIVF